jgi:diguanylate cyclase (GGDEF)-like protein
VRREAFGIVIAGRAIQVVAAFNRPAQGQVMLRNSYISVLILIGILLVGVVDYLSGTEVRVFPLYFLPLIPAAWVFGRTGAVGSSLVATAAWAASLYLAGSHYSHGYIWLINVLTQGATFLVVSLLIAWLHASLQRERVLSSTDTLTRLANRRAFYEQAGAALALCHRKSNPVSLAYIDLDNFKQVNDAYGHGSGDALLRAVGEILRSCLRASDVSGRFGGDEFVIMLPDTTADHARTVLEKIRIRIAQTPEVRACSVTVSIGAVAYPKAPTDISVMIKAADELMYSVKNGGKDGVEVQAAIAA